MVANVVIGAARFLLPSIFRVAARNPIKTGLALDGIFNGFAGTRSVGTTAAQFVGKQALGFLGLNGKDGLLGGLTNKF
ncbi:MAG TPA: hypothetical protein PLF01_05390, partial [Alphaproteobacteria bacterium]|nr:hypothetical protein [Alphaproteobacteria bacterium]